MPSSRLHSEAHIRTSIQRPSVPLAASTSPKASGPPGSEASHARRTNSISGLSPIAVIVAHPLAGGRGHFAVPLRAPAVCLRSPDRRTAANTSESRPASPAFRGFRPCSPAFASSAKTATLVPVTIGETSAGINAKLQLGGRISGRVTAAGSGPLSNVLVCALSSPSEAVACALTGRDGEYAIAGVPAGSYVVGFQAAKTYAVQYYDDQATYAAAQIVQVTAGAGTAGIGALVSPPSAPPSPPPPPNVPQHPQPPTNSAPSTSSPSTPAPTSTTESGVAAYTGSAPAHAALVSLPLATSLISGQTAQVTLTCSGARCAGTAQLSTQTRRGDLARHRHARIPCGSEQSRRNVAHTYAQDEHQEKFVCEPIRFTEGEAIGSNTAAYSFTMERGRVPIITIWAANPACKGYESQQVEVADGRSRTAHTNRGNCADPLHRLGRR
jgi:hypothetical protein